MAREVAYTWICSKVWLTVPCCCFFESILCYQTKEKKYWTHCNFLLKLYRTGQKFIWVTFGNASVNTISLSVSSLCYHVEEKNCGAYFDSIEGVAHVGAYILFLFAVNIQRIFIVQVLLRCSEKVKVHVLTPLLRL